MRQQQLAKWGTLISCSLIWFVIWLDFSIVALSFGIRLKQAIEIENLKHIP